MDDVSFSDIAIVSCGTLSIELNHLKKEGFLDTHHLFFTTPGLHEDVHELECQLVQRINKAKADELIQLLIQSIKLSLLCFLVSAFCSFLAFSAAVL